MFDSCVFSYFWRGKVRFITWHILAPHGTTLVVLFFGSAFCSGISRGTWGNSEPIPWWTVWVLQYLQNLYRLIMMKLHFAHLYLGNTCVCSIALQYLQLWKENFLPFSAWFNQQDVMKVQWVFNSWGALFPFVPLCSLIILNLHSSSFVLIHLHSPSISFRFCVPLRPPWRVQRRTSRRLRKGGTRHVD